MGRTFHTPAETLRNIPSRERDDGQGTSVSTTRFEFLRIPGRNGAAPTPGCHPFLPLFIPSLSGLFRWSRSDGRAPIGALGPSIRPRSALRG